MWYTKFSTLKRIVIDFFFQKLYKQKDMNMGNWIPREKFPRLSLKFFSPKIHHLKIEILKRLFLGLIDKRLQGCMGYKPHSTKASGV